MKKEKINLGIIAIMICLMFSSCKKEETPSIENINYPELGFYGINLLNISDTIYKYDSGPQYGDGPYISLKAVLPNMNSSVTIEMTGTDIFINHNQGWFTKADIYTTGQTIIFRAEGAISADLQLYLKDSGLATIKIFENDSALPTRIKEIKKEN